MFLHKMQVNLRKIDSHVAVYFRSGVNNAYLVRLCGLGER
ncbi:hypothetical protein SpAn4DRAFT_1107 [Sporomusa ovata]|uniref:Uncharacterized protein n=1 Tax=Sporomusa ovata TaxID=2378 RepID=A0A0U1L560_9FIRM|nr:hypothetical protein SpAn4DRAFT_1107 [Sporomusa ovata]